VPTNTAVSKDNGARAAGFSAHAVGKNVTFQTSVGYSALIGPVGRRRGTLEYSAVVGYAIDRSVLAVPGVRRIIPMAELVGDLPFNGAGRG